MTEQFYGPEYANSWAIIIGIDDYKDPRLAPLGTAVKGARAVADLLRTQFSFDPDKVILLENEHATQGAIRRAFTDPLSRIDKVTKDDRVIIYFGGHGVTYDTAEGDIGSVSAYDTELAYWDTAIPMDELTRLANRSHAKHVLFLLDACFSGYATTRSAESGTQRQREDYMTRPARQVIAAGTRDQVVSDTWGPGGHSLFTGFLLEGLSGAAPAPGGLLRVYHLAGYLQDAVAQHSRSRQTPQYAALMGSQGGDFIFATRPVAELGTGDLAALKSDNPAERVSAVGRLREKIQTGSPELADQAFTHLQELTTDPDEMVRASARGALRALLPETSIAPLVRQRLLATPLEGTSRLKRTAQTVYAVLSFTAGSAVGWRYEMVDAALTIGRAPDNILSFPEDEKLSRKHVRLEARDDHVWLIDQNSANGTFVNAVRLTGPHSLSDGDLVRFGGMELSVSLAAPTAAPEEKATVVDSKELGKQLRDAQAALVKDKAAADANEPIAAAPAAVHITVESVVRLKAALRLTGHTQSVTCVAWSPDGTRLATGSLDKTVMTWDAKGQQSFTFQGHTSPISGIAWSLDGVRLASASWDSTVSIWDSMSGRRLRVLKGSGVLICVAWSLDGATLVSGSRNGSIMVWDAATGDHQRDLAAHTNVVHGLAWSPDGVWLASGAADRVVLIWDMFSGEWVKSLEGHSDEVQCLAWSPDARYIASGSLDGKIIVWDVPTGKPHQTWEGGVGQVLSIAWSPVNGLVASGHDNGAIIIWEAKTGKRLRVLDVHNKAVTRVEWSPDGTQLASSSLDGRVILWAVPA